MAKQLGKQKFGDLEAARKLLEENEKLRIMELNRDLAEWCKVNKCRIEPIMHYDPKNGFKKGITIIIQK